MVADAAAAVVVVVAAATAAAAICGAVVVMEVEIIIHDISLGKQLESQYKPRFAADQEVAFIEIRLYMQYVHHMTVINLLT